MRHEVDDTFTLTCTAGAFASQQYSCNGMFQPKTGGGGHQPVYFDQMTAIYDHYTVFRAQIRIEFLPNSTFFSLAGYIDDDTSVVSSVTHAWEQTTGKGGIYPNFAVKPMVINLSWNARDYFGGDIFDNDNLQGTAAANPTEQSYFTVCARPTDNTTTGTVAVRIRIIYEAVWDELTTIAQS